MITISSVMLVPSSTSPPLRRAAIIGALFAAAALVAGCSVLRVAYEQGPWLVYRWLDAYARFDGDQPAQVRERIAEWWRWHRATQLAADAALLARAADEVLADATPQQVCGWASTLRGRVDAYVDRALPDLAATAATLTAAQVDRIERRLAEKDDERRAEQTAGPPEAVFARRLAQAVERSERLYGRLGAAQREQLARNVAESPYDASVSFAERAERRRDLVATLRRASDGRLGVDQALAEAEALVGRLRRSPRDAYRAYRETLDAHDCAAAARFHNATTPGQRRVASARLAGWAADLRALARPSGLG